MPAGLDALLGSSDPAARARGATVLMTAAERYAQALRTGQPLQSRFPAEWAQRPAAYDAAGALRRALAEDRLGAWLASLAPPSPAYAQLQAALARYQDIARRGGWLVVPAGAVLKPGANNDGVWILRSRLAAEDAAVAPGDGRLFDAQLGEAVARFQGRHGLTPTGTVDKATLAELNVTAAQRVDQIRANMERRRWEPREPAPTRIEVNIAAAVLDYFRGGVRDLSMRTVVGRPQDRTPIFSDVVEAVVFNPPWNVPAGIAEKEIWPKAKDDPGYLARNHYVVVAGSGGRGLQQQPGPDSALGQIKFDLPNRFDVYLHDTPSRSAFARDQRALSHGCIRLERPADLARRVLQGDPAWNPTAIQAALDSGTTMRAVLTSPVPVSIAYWTVFEDAAGELNFHPDVYGWDAALLRLEDGVQA